VLTPLFLILGPLLERKTKNKVRSTKYEVQNKEQSTKYEVLATTQKHVPDASRDR
jgi:hypothetical protein